MTTTPVRTSSPAPTAAPGTGTPADEKKAAVSMVAAGFALGGPVGGIVMALAIGIEQAFGKSGWEQPSWLGGEGGTKLTPEEIQQRHDEAVQRAREYVEEARRQARERAETLKRHRKDMKDWTEGGKTGPKPERPDMRGPWEFMGNAWGASKSWYTLFDDKMAKGNEKITGTYPVIADFFRGLWDFVTGFAEGVSSIKDGWNEYRELNKDQPEPAPLPDPVLTPEPQSPDPQQLPADDLNSDPGFQPPVEPDREPIKVSATVPPSTTTPDPAVTAPVPHQIDPSPTGPGEGTAEGEPMTTTDNATALPAGDDGEHMGPQGETNLDLLHQAFAPAAPVLVSVTEQVDELKPQAQAVAARVARIASLCGVNGVPIVVYQMMAQARQLTRVVSAGLVEIDTHNEIARDLTDQALIGLVPAQDDLNTTRSEQASGDLYNRAGH